MAPTRAQLLALGTSVIEAFKAWTVDGLIAVRAPNCTAQVLPTTLNQPPKNNDEAAEFFTAVNPLALSPWEVEYNEKDSVVDVERRMVVVYAKAAVDTPVGKYRNEYVITLTSDESGKLVEKWDEFMDSIAFSEFFKKVEALKSQSEQK